MESNIEKTSKERMESLELTLVRAMENMITGKEEYTYAEVNAVLVKLLNHNLREELKGEWSAEKK